MPSMQATITATYGGGVAFEKLGVSMDGSFSDVHIVDGSNSAPVNRLFIPLFTRFCTAEKMTFQNCF